MPVLVAYMLLFLVVGVGFIFVHLIAGKLIRPAKPDPDKLTIYECGEPTIGSAWIQFDLRFYVVALLFVIFDVEVAFFFPWAVVFGKTSTLANTRLEAADRAALTRQIDPGYQTRPARSVAGPGEQAQVAGQFAWIAFWDIVIFFGLLLMGFAYLWKRGDLDWVRSTAAERAAPPPLQPAPPAEPATLVGAGRENW
jgi:NADH-quinone oxidoreductase subunit A